VPRRLDLAIDSRAELVGLIGAALRGLCAEAGLSAEAAGDVELAVCEAVTNVIKHGHGDRPGHVVRVEAVVAEGLEVTVVDDGAALDPARLAAADPARPFDPADIAALPESGFGLGLIKALMDEAAYSSAAGENRLRLLKRRAAPA